MSLAGLAIAGGDDNGNDGYTLSLKELIKQAQGNIDRVDLELENQKITKENEKRETAARLYFEKGNALYKQGKLKEAREQWQEALDLTSHPDMKKYIRQSDSKARDQMKTQKVKRVYPKAKSVSAVTKTAKPKISKEEKQPPQRGYDIFVR